MRITAKLLFVAIVLTLSISSSVTAQTPSLIDTLYLVVENQNDTVGVKRSELVIDVYLSLHSGNMTGASFGLTWDRQFDTTTLPESISHSESDWQFDSLKYQGNFFNHSGSWFTFPIKNTEADSMGGVPLLGFSFTSGIAPASELLMAKLYLSLTSGNTWDIGDQVRIDSTFLPPAAVFGFIIAGGQYLLPTFIGPSVIGYSPTPCCVIPGDFDNDNLFDIADVTAGINRIFVTGSPAPICQDQADFNSNRTFNIIDVTLGIKHMFSSGADPICGLTGK